MRSESVLTHRRCNQACTFCTARRATDDPRFVAHAAVVARIDAAVAAGVGELVLSGGEPTMRSDLPALIAHARARGVPRICVETNATLLDPARAAALATAGLDLARVHLSGWGDALDAVTRDPGGFVATLRGIDALRAAGVKTEIAAALTRSTAGMLPALPHRLRERFGPGFPHGLVVFVPLHSPAPAELLSYPEAAPVLVALERAARAAELPVKLHPGTAPPPCVFTARERPHHLFSLAPGMRHRAHHRKLPACAGCQLDALCDGFAEDYLARFPTADPTPITDDRARRRLSLIASVDEQIARELVTPNLYKAEAGGDAAEDVIRVNFHCNQACRFCFVSTHLPAPGDRAVRDAIESAGRRDVKITLSGGEPTLNPRLAEYVALAKAVSTRPVQLQTNATRLDDPALCDALVAAGLDEAFVSLHGSTAEVSDAVTAAPGTFARTVVGVDNLARAPVRLILNFVICETNLRDLVGFVRLVAARWPSAFANVSFVAPSTDVVPRDREMIPRYADALPEIAAAMAEAARLGVELGGFESMCGIPLCLVPASLTRYLGFDELPPGFDGGEFVKAPACEGCALATRCFGVRRGYVALHGAGELRRV